MNNKTVYIIIPVYNVEKYLKKCLDSVFEQTYRNIFVICINDGSTDCSLATLQYYSRLHENMMVVNKTNGGLASARNAGLKIIHNMQDGYVAFLDSDDWLDCNFVSRMVYMLETNDVDIVCASFYFCGLNSMVLYTGNTTNSQVVDGLLGTKLLLKDETIQSHVWSKLFKIELLDSIFFDEKLSYMEDQSFTFQAMYRAHKVMITNYGGYYYFQGNNNSLTKTELNNSKIISALLSYYSVCNYNFKEKDKEILLSAAHSGLAAVYLMLFPRFNFKDAEDKQIEFMSTLKLYIKKNKVIYHYHPKDKKGRIKKVVYLLIPFLYSYFYRIHKQIKII